MKNGNINEFVDKIHYGDELVFLYKGNKYFLQGFKENGVCTLYLDRWVPPAGDYLWKKDGDAVSFPVDDFLNAPIWDGKRFWDIESEIEWVDC